MSTEQDYISKPHHVVDVTTELEVKGPDMDGDLNFAIRVASKTGTYVLVQTYVGREDAIKLVRHIATVLGIKPGELA